MDNTQALKSNQGNFDSIMALSGEALADLKWSINSVQEVKKRENPDHHDNLCFKKGVGVLCGGYLHRGLMDTPCCC